MTSIYTTILIPLSQSLTMYNTTPLYDFQKAQLHNLLQDVHDSDNFENVLHILAPFISETDEDLVTEQLLSMDNSVFHYLISKLEADTLIIETSIPLAYTFVWYYISNEPPFTIKQGEYWHPEEKNCRKEGILSTPDIDMPDAHHLLLTVKSKCASCILHRPQLSICDTCRSHFQE